MKVFICDNDSRYAQECKKSVEKVAAKHSIDVDIFMYPSGRQMLFNERLLADVDLIYLEEGVPGMSGMETARELRELKIPADIVFYTADESIARCGYDVEALHVVLKDDTSDAKFEEIFLKAALRCRRRREEFLLLSCAGEHRNICISDIRYFEVKNRIVSVVYDTNNNRRQPKRFDFYSTLSRIEEKLFGRGFVRIHRSYLVRKNLIANVSAQTVELASGEVLPIGRAYRPLDI